MPGINDEPGQVEQIVELADGGRSDLDRRPGAVPARRDARTSSSTGCGRSGRTSSSATRSCTARAPTCPRARAQELTARLPGRRRKGRDVAPRFERRAAAGARAADDPRPAAGAADDAVLSATATCIRRHDRTVALGHSCRPGMKPGRTGQCWLWDMLRARQKPRFDATRARRRGPARSRCTRSQRARRARRELLLIVPLIAATIVATSSASRSSASTRPRASPPRSCSSSSAGRWRATSAAGPSRGCSAASTPAPRARSASSSASSFLAIAALVRAADRRPRPAHAGRRWCHHRRRLRSRRPADARQPDRRHGADLRAPVPDRRPRAPAGRRPRRPDRGHRRLARPALHRPSPRARTRSWSPTTSCSARRSCRCASPPRSTCARACAPTSSPPRSRSCSHDRRPHPRARRAAHLARGDRLRRGRRAHRRHARVRGGRPAARRRGPVRDRLRHPRGRHRRAHGRAHRAQRRHPGAHGGPPGRAAAPPSTWPSASACPSGPRPSPRRCRASRAGAARGRSARAASRPPRYRGAAASGATSISERLRSIALTTAAATSSGVRIAT